jgi:hypothetical protein
MLTESRGSLGQVDDPVRREGCGAGSRKFRLRVPEGVPVQDPAAGRSGKVALALGACTGSSRRKVSRSTSTTSGRPTTSAAPPPDDVRTASLPPD